MSCTIIQWNIQSWRSNFCDLKQIIQVYKPVCVCLQETLMNNSSIYPPSNYKILHSNPTRTDGHDRGVAILTRSDKNHQTITLYTNLQAVAVRIFLDRWYTICCIYLPFVPFTENEINGLISQLPRPFLLLGDFNSRSQVLGDTVTNPRGSIIERVLLNN